jgi:hypothetical protein
MTDAPERDVVEQLQEAAQSIRADGTPAQVGLSADEHEDIAREITRLRSQVAGIPPQDRQAVADELKLVSAFLFEDQAYGLMDIVERAIAMLQASPSPPVGEDGWRDISTAPKDGTYIDIWGINPAGRRYTDMRWTDFPEVGAVEGFTWRDWQGVRAIDHADAVATHWMPRPAPPGVSPPVSAAPQSWDAEMLSIRSNWERMETALRTISSMSKEHEHDLFSATQVAKAALSDKETGQ